MYAFLPLRYLLDLLFHFLKAHNQLHNSNSHERFDRSIRLQTWSRSPFIHPRIKLTMYSFDPFRNNISRDELASFMHQNFPLVVFDQDMSISKLQAIAQKWIDIGKCLTYWSSYWSWIPFNCLWMEIHHLQFFISQQPVLQHKSTLTPHRLPSPNYCVGRDVMVMVSLIH